MYRKLSDDVDVSTMLSMRESGMPNPQIAERLGCSYKTVLKYIGRQPKELNMVRVNDFKPVIENPDPDVVAYKKVCPPILKVVSTVSTLEGDLNKYIIDTGNRSVEISGVVEGILDDKSLSRFIKELTEIKQIFQNVGCGVNE